MSKKAKWPESISDGLSLPCKMCGNVPRFDYRAQDDLWRMVVPEECRLWVVCLPCFDKVACSKSISIARGIVNIQYTGIGKTICFVPFRVHEYQSPSK